MREPEDRSSIQSENGHAALLAGQTVVVIGGSAGIGLDTGRLARAEGAQVILTARDSERLSQAAQQIGTQQTAAFDVTDAAAVARFFNSLPAPIDHVMVTGPGPTYGRLLEMDSDQLRDALSDHIVVDMAVTRNAVGKMRPGGTLIFMGGTGGRRVAGLGTVPAATAAMPAFVATLALEIAPLRANLIAAGFVDTPLSATLLGDELEARRQELRETLPIGRVVGPADVAALAVHLMTNTALTGATYDIDGGQQFL
jgi:NAD(P)-dependent dehydrogenase (short-subunit alcohol dehydrogenase family)